MNTAESNPPYFEAEITQGLGELALNELSQLKGVRRAELSSPESIRFNYRHKRSWEMLRHLKLINAIHFVQPFTVPRPKSLLGHANWQIISKHIERVREQMPSEKFKSIYIQAAGKQTSVLQRIQHDIAKDTKLRLVDQGDLLLRIRKGKNSRWEVTTRLTARPMATRSWRVANMPGALNGPIAAAMAQFASITPETLALNVMCGSASIMIEALTLSEHKAYGCDLSTDSLEAARRNLISARARDAKLQQADAQALPYPANKFDVVFADLPWGQLIGSHTANKQLHPSSLREMARVLKANGRCVILTHEVKLLRDILKSSTVWIQEQTISIKKGNIQPTIFVLKKRQL